MPYLQTIITEKTEKQTTDEAWRQVGRQFQTLGESLAEAVRTAWKSEGTRRHVQNMQDGLEAAIPVLYCGFRQQRHPADLFREATGRLHSLDADPPRIISWLTEPPFICHI